MEDSLENYFAFRMQVYSDDIDSSGIVHHSNYIKFMERARLAWLLQKGIRLDTLTAKGIGFVIKKVDIEYLAPAFLYDQLEIQSRVIYQRRVAKIYQQTVLNAEDPNLIYCKGIIHVVCVNKQLRPIALPSELQEKFE
jgi:acyl-CoA thioester hydrolase